MKESQKDLIVLTATEYRAVEKKYMDAPYGDNLTMMLIAQKNLDQAIAGEFEIGAGITLSTDGSSNV